MSPCCNNGTVVLAVNFRKLKNNFFALYTMLRLLLLEVFWFASQQLFLIKSSSLQIYKSLCKRNFSSRSMHYSFSIEVRIPLRKLVSVVYI